MRSPRLSAKTSRTAPPSGVSRQRMPREPAGGGPGPFECRDAEDRRREDEKQRDSSHGAVEGYWAEIAVATCGEAADRLSGNDHSDRDRRRGQRQAEPAPRAGEQRAAASPRAVASSGTGGIRARSKVLSRERSTVRGRRRRLLADERRRRRARAGRRARAAARREGRLRRAGGRTHVHANCEERGGLGNACVVMTPPRPSRRRSCSAPGSPTARSGRTSAPRTIARPPPADASMR